MKDILQAARKTITKPDRWVKGSLALNAPHGQRVHPAALDAKCWCAMGAVMRATNELRGAWNHPDFEVVNVALAQAMGRGVPGFNDTSTHEQVLQAFDKAIEAAQ